MYVIVVFSENGVNSLSFAEFEENSIYYMHDSAWKTFEKLAKKFIYFKKQKKDFWPTNPP